MMPKPTKKGTSGLKHDRFRSWTIAILAVLLVAEVKVAASTSSSKFLGTYLNEGNALIEIDIISRDGKDGVTIPLEPGHIERTTISPGTTKLCLPSRNGQERQTLWSGPTPTPTSAPGYFDKRTRMFYFRIIGKKLILVRPQDLTDVERTKIKWYDEVLRKDAETR
jgi:hypothetical protein